MRKGFLLILAPAFLAVGAGTPPRKLGPEWTRVGDEYERTVAAKVTRADGGNVSNYHVPLEKDKLFVHESDGDRGFEVGSHPYGSWEVEKDARGQVEAYTVVLGKMRYFDLNGDGVIEAMYDRKANQPMIFIDGRYVKVEDSKRGFADKRVRAVGRGTDYVFQGDHWIAK